MDRNLIKKKIEELRFLIEQEQQLEPQEQQLEPQDLPDLNQVKGENSDETPDNSLEKVSKDELPSKFPVDGIKTVVKSIISMGITSAIVDLADDLEESYLELDGLTLDIQLRLLGIFATEELIDDAATRMSKLIIFGREIDSNKE